MRSRVGNTAGTAFGRGSGTDKQLLNLNGRLNETVPRTVEENTTGVLTVRRHSFNTETLLSSILCSLDGAARCKRKRRRLIF